MGLRAEMRARTLLSILLGVALWTTGCGSSAASHGNPWNVAAVEIARLRADWSTVTLIAVDSIGPGEQSLAEVLGFSLIQASANHPVPCRLLGESHHVPDATMRVDLKYDGRDSASVSVVFACLYQREQNVLTSHTSFLIELRRSSGRWHVLESKMIPAAGTSAA